MDATKLLFEGVAIVLSGAALAWIKAMSAAQREVELKVAALAAKVESHDGHLSALKDDIDKRLERVEAKLDRLLEDRK